MSMEFTPLHITRWYERPKVWIAILVLAIIVGVAVWQLPSAEAPVIETVPDVPIDEPVTPLVIQGPTLNPADPVALRIPKIEIDATFEGPLGLNEDQSIEVPDSYEALGWYEYGPTPGEAGPAVILGHVDSFEGPAVFFRLGQLEVGDEIEVDRADGTTAVFAVTELLRARQNDFPTAQVYGDIDHAGLRLITCSGTFSRGIQRYSHNLIVFARLVSVT
jgi:sortase (surface protein transpeptidase)